MAASVSIITRGTLGNRKAVLATLTLDSSYPTGGYSLTPRDLGMTTFDAIFCEDRSGRTYHYDATNQKVQCYQHGASGLANASLGEAANTTNLSTETVILLAFGTGN